MTGEEIKEQVYDAVACDDMFCRLELRDAICDMVDENEKLRGLVSSMYRNMQGVLDRSTDTVWVDKIATLRDCMDIHMEKMAELGMPPRDYKSRMRELGIEVE